MIAEYVHAAHAQPDKWALIGMSEYSAVRVGKLRLKGSAGESLKSKKKRKRKREITQEEMKKEDLRHGVYCQ